MVSDIKDRIKPTKKRYFGTDGIRGTVGQRPMTPDFVLKLANAVGQVLKRTDMSPTVVIGKDTRLSGYMMESALESGFNSAGVDVVLLGPLPTPGVAYLTHALRANLGVVITASHNPFSDNGIKFFNSSGSKLDDTWEWAVEAALEEPPQWVEASQIGRARRLSDASGRYLEFCKNSFARDLSLKGLRLVIDAAHGAAYQIAPQLFEELGAEVIAMGCAPDGHNINHQVGVTYPKALQEAVLTHQAHLGIALDGDGDRLQMVDASGRLFDGDQLLYLLAQARVRDAQRTSQEGQAQPLMGVVGTLMTNLGIEKALNDLGLSMIRAQVGDRYVLEALQSRGWVLGGEGSGHLLILDKHSTGDGLVSALQVLQVLIRYGSSLAEMLSPVTLMAQAMVNVSFQAHPDKNQELPLAKNWTPSEAFLACQQAIEAQMHGKGRILVRQSGTEPVLRIMVEAPDARQADAWAQELASMCGLISS
jgi:phosphoglucosamine mutase